MKKISVLISIIALIGLSRGETCIKPQDCTHELCRGSHLACHHYMCTCDPDINSPQNSCVTMDDCDRVGLCLKPGTRLTCIDSQCSCVIYKSALIKFLDRDRHSLVFMKYSDQELYFCDSSKDC